MKVVDNHLGLSNTWRRLVYTSALFVVICSFVILNVSPSYGAKTHTYNIPSMPLNEALIEFGLQSQRSVLYSGLKVTGKRSSPVVGEMTEQQALKAMLRRTRLVGELTPRAAIRLEPKKIVWPKQAYSRDSKNDKRRADILETRDDVIRQLIAQNPDALEDIEEAAGYAVFSSTGVNLVFVAAGGGRGVAHDNRTGEDIFMRMAMGGLVWGWVSKTSLAYSSSIRVRLWMHLSKAAGIFPERQMLRQKAPMDVQPSTVLSVVMLSPHMC